MAEGEMKGDMPERFSHRSDPRVPAFPDDRPIVVFDGSCALGWARFVLRRDRQGRYRLLPAQSPLGLRDALYFVTARNRFRWFGRRETCCVLEPGREGRFLA